MRQLIEPNLSIPYVGGLCEGYVEGMWGQATLPTRRNQMTYGVYGNAVSPVNAGETGKWDSNPGNGNHPNEIPPTGVKVPLYFWLGSTPAGHTATWLGDGCVISSSQDGYNESGMIHSSIQALIDYYAPANNGCRYLGYSTYVGNIKVVEMEDTMDAQDIRQIGGEIWGRPVDEITVNNLKGQSWHDVMYYLVGAYPWVNRKNDQVKNQNKIIELNKTIKKLQDESISNKKLEQIKAIVNA